MRVTIKDVAREAGVSVSTVSYALNKKGEPIKDSHKRVIDAAKRLGYVPDATARSLVNSRTNSIGVVIRKQKHKDEYNPYEVELIAAFSSELAKCKNWMNLYLDNGDNNSLLEQLVIDAKVDGMIWAGEKIPNQIQNILKVRSVPYVIVLAPEANPEVSTVQINGEHGVVEAIRYLVSLGHRKILNIAGFPNMATKRRCTYINTLENMGICSHKEIFCYYNENLAYEEVKKLLIQNDNRPTAIFAENDNMALSAMRAAKDLGFKVPEDISIVGFDDIYATQISDPPLTTIRQDLNEVARLACEYLIKCRDSKISLPLIHEKVPTKLIIRGSTGKVPAF